MSAPCIRKKLREFDARRVPSPSRCPGPGRPRGRAQARRALVLTLWAPRPVAALAAGPDPTPQLLEIAWDAGRTMVAHGQRDCHAITFSHLDRNPDWLHD